GGEYVVARELQAVGAHVGRARQVEARRGGGRRGCEEGLVASNESPRAGLRGAQCVGSGEAGRRIETVGGDEGDAAGHRGGDEGGGTVFAETVDVSGIRARIAAV